MPGKTIFLSYAQKNMSIANGIEHQLQKLGYVVKRDIHDVQQWGSIRSFMKTIRDEDYVVFLVSDTYLRRENCVFEIMQFLKDEKNDYRAFPVAISFTKKETRNRQAAGLATSMFDLDYFAEIVSYWQNKAEEVKARISSVAPENRAELDVSYREIANMAQSVSQFLFYNFRDKLLKTINPEVPDFNDVAAAIHAKVTNDNNLSSKDSTVTHNTIMKNELTVISKTGFNTLGVPQTSEEIEMDVITTLEPGINRDLLIWAMSSPLYKNAVGNYVQKEEKLVLALGTYEDDRYTGSLDLMKAIWRNHPRLGLPPDYEHLISLEFDRAFYPKYRDHTTHMFKVFLLGLYLYENQTRIRKAINDYGLNDSDFLAIWILASLFHDAGYMIENERTTGNDLAASIVYQRMTEMLSRPLWNLFPNDFGKITEASILVRLNMQAPRIDHMYPLKNSLQEFKGKGRSVRLTVHDDDNPILLYFNNTQGKHEGRSYFDHGIVSAGMMLFQQAKLCEYYKVFPEGELNSIQKDRLKTVRDAIPQYTEYVKKAAFAVALHNLKKDWSGERMLDFAIDGVRLDEFRIPLDTELEPGCGPEPIAYLLRLCDELQCWDRMYYSSPVSGPTPLHGNKLCFHGKGETMTLRISDDTTKASISDALSGVLMPPIQEILPIV